MNKTLLGFFWNTTPKSYLCLYELKSIENGKYVDVMGRKWSYFSRQNPLDFEQETINLLVGLNRFDLEIQSFKYKPLFSKI